MNRHYHGSGSYVGLGYPPPPNTFAISNNTNSNDPQAKLSRMFVGNINPREVTDRMQLYHLFIKYGDIRAISLHKGYAFVQFKTEAEARTAVAQENGNLLGTQKLDLCISTERNKAAGGFKRYDTDFDGGYQSAQAKKRRFQDNTLMDKKSGDEPTTWICSYCKHVSISAWELMKHAAAVHQTQIYDLNGAKEEGGE